MSEKPRPVLGIIVVDDELGDYAVGEVKITTILGQWDEEGKARGRLMLEGEVKGKKFKSELPLGEWWADGEKFRLLMPYDCLQAPLFKQTGRNMDVIGRIMTEHVVIAEARKKIEELKKELQDPVEEERIRELIKRVVTSPSKGPADYAPRSSSRRWDAAL